MSEFSDENEVEAPSAPQPSQSDKEVAYWKAEAEKAFKARDDARKELRTTIQAGYDPEVAELVPQDLPPAEWKAYADKLLAFRGTQPNPPAEASAEAQQEAAPTPPETQGLATVAGQAPGMTAVQPQQLSGKELMELYASDPAEAMRQAQAKYRL